MAPAPNVPPFDSYWPLTTEEAPLSNGPTPHIPAGWVYAPRRVETAGRQNATSSGFRGPLATPPLMGQRSYYTPNRLQWSGIRDINAQVRVDGQYVSGRKRRRILGTLARNDVLHAQVPKSPNEC